MVGQQNVGGAVASGRFALRKRTLEWVGVSVSLFLYSGALFPTLLAPEGLDDAARAKLRVLALPAYIITLVLLSPHLGQLVVALRRNLILAFLLALPFASVAWSISGSITIRRAVALLLSVSLAFLISIRFTPRQFMLLVTGLLTVFMVLSLIFAIAVPRWGWMPPDAEASGLRGIFIHKNVLGWYAAQAVMVSLLMIIEGLFVPRLASVLLLAISLMCLILSASMTAMITVCAGFLILLFFCALPRLRRSTLIFSVLLLVQLGALILISIETVLVPVLESLGKDATLTGRIPLWHLVDAEINRRFVLGFGYQAFWTEANPEAWRVWTAVGWPAPHAHNGYRDMLLNFGFFGFIAFAIMILRAIHQGVTLHSRAPRDGWLWLNIVVGMYLSLNTTESTFLVQNDMLFVIFAASIVMFGLRAPEISLSRKANLRFKQRDAGSETLFDGAVGLGIATQRRM